MNSKSKCEKQKKQREKIAKEYNVNFKTIECENKDKCKGICIKSQQEEVELNKLIIASINKHSNKNAIMIGTLIGCCLAIITVFLIVQSNLKNREDTTNILNNQNVTNEVSK